MHPLVIPGIIELTETEMWSITFACVMMAMDIFTGFLGAFVRGCVSSTKMREGIGHKAMLILLIVLAALVQTATLHIGDMGWAVPLIMPACIYIIVMEVASIVENIEAAYPGLSETPLLKLFDRISGAGGGDDDE